MVCWLQTNKGEESLVNIANVILQGVNNTNDQQIYDIGMKIYNEISLPQTVTPKQTMDNYAPATIPVEPIKSTNTQGN